jgi:hypothetical protein
MQPSVMSSECRSGSLAISSRSADIRTVVGDRLFIRRWSLYGSTAEGSRSVESFRLANEIHNAVDDVSCG